MGVEGDVNPFKEEMVQKDAWIWQLNIKKSQKNLSHVFKRYNEKKRNQEVCFACIRGECRDMFDFANI